MNELIEIIRAFLDSDAGPELFDDDGEALSGYKALEAAQLIAEAIVAAGWPRQEPA